MRYRYLGRPVSNWYGLDLETGEVVTLPPHLAHKADNSPTLFEMVDPASPAQPETADSEPQAEAPKRRGRPRKTQE